MNVSISTAAKMVGITRATFYRHIQKKGITVKKDDDGNPKVDVSELVRVYGDKIKTPQQVDIEARQKKGTDEAGELLERTKETMKENAAKRERVEMDVLRERLKALEEEKNVFVSERKRERDMFQEQIETLRESLQQSQEQQKRLTLMITDQREEQGRGMSVAGEAQRIEALNETIEALRKQNKAIIRKIKQQEEESAQPFWKKLFG